MTCFECLVAYVIVSIVLAILVNKFPNWFGQSYEGDDI